MSTESCDVNNNLDLVDPNSLVGGMSVKQLQTVISALGTLFTNKANEHKSTTSTITPIRNEANNELSQSNIKFLENLAQVLGTHIDEHLMATKEARVVPATTYNSASSTITASSLSSSSSPSSPQPVLEAHPKTIYNNYFSKPIGIENYFTNMLNGDLANKPRPSISTTADQSPWKTTLPDVTCTSTSGGGNGEESIRINLPEILDQNDEITILRLLIKLLSSKVGRLGEEKRQLLEHLNELNDINIQMSYMIEHGFK